MSSLSLLSNQISRAVEDLTNPSSNDGSVEMRVRSELSTNYDFNSVPRVYKPIDRSLERDQLLNVIRWQTPKLLNGIKAVGLISAVSGSVDDNDLAASIAGAGDIAGLTNNSRKASELLLQVAQSLGLKGESDLIDLSGDQLGGLNMSDIIMGYKAKVAAKFRDALFIALDELRPNNRCFSKESDTKSEALNSAQGSFHYVVYADAAGNVDTTITGQDAQGSVKVPCDGKLTLQIVNQRKGRYDLPFDVGTQLVMTNATDSYTIPINNEFIEVEVSGGGYQLYTAAQVNIPTTFTSRSISVYPISFEPAPNNDVYLKDLVGINSQASFRSFWSESALFVMAELRLYASKRIRAGYGAKQLFNGACILSADLHDALIKDIDPLDLVSWFGSITQAPNVNVLPEDWNRAYACIKWSAILYLIDVEYHAQRAANDD